jgi:hypothetical protein
VSLFDHVTPRQSVFSANRTDTVLSLDDLLEGRVDAQEFFAESYVTAGMHTLIERTFQRLAGGATGSPVFTLTQAMGGGKTHSMIALALLAMHPEVRAGVFAEWFGGQNLSGSLGRVRVIGYNGRNTDARLGIWGELARQLGRQEHFAGNYTPLTAPGSQTWTELLRGDPLIILLDELPPYLEHAHAVAIGNSDLAQVTASALANLFVAVARLTNVTVVISDLAGQAWSGGSEVLLKAVEALRNLTNEVGRTAVPLSPVNPQSDELFRILNRRLFAALPGESVIRGVAGRYRDAHAEAVAMGLTTTASDGVSAQIMDSYPLHHAWRPLIGRFKENQTFQQTRGVIRLMQAVVANTWESGRAHTLDLLHPYDLDLNDQALSSEVRVINTNLHEAMAHDVASNGTAEAEQVDATNRTKDASEAATLLLVASLSTVPGAITGLRDFEIYDFLQRPGRDLSRLKADVLEQLEARAWYLHRSSDGRLFFKNQQNLAAKLRSEEQALNEQTVADSLRKFLRERFDPVGRDVYQVLHVMTAFDEVQLEQDRVALVLTTPTPGTQGVGVSQEWLEWWKRQTFQNRVVFLTGSKLVMDTVRDSARRYRALESIEAGFKADSVAAADPNWAALESLKDRVRVQLASALKQAFDTVVYPSINASLRARAIDVPFDSKGDGRGSGEKAIRDTLVAEQKFADKTGPDELQKKAEARLFTAKSLPWAEVKRQAATITTWQLHHPNALEGLRDACVQRGEWREQGTFIEKGPFPPPETSVRVKVLSRDDDSGTTWLALEALHGDTIYYETGESEPTTSSTKVAAAQRFEATGLRYQFRAYDSTGKNPAGPAVSWAGTVTLKYDPKAATAGSTFTLKAIPGGQIRYTTDATNPRTGAIYDGPFQVPAGCRIIQAIATAEGVESEQLDVRVHPKVAEAKQQFGGDAAPGGGVAPLIPQWQIDSAAPAIWKRAWKADDNAATYRLLKALRKADGRVFNVSLWAADEAEAQTIDFTGTATPGYTADELQALCERFQELVGAGAKVTLKAPRVVFARGAELLEFAQAVDLSVVESEIVQGADRG